jgi:hypothetical protein
VCASTASAVRLTDGELPVSAMEVHLDGALGQPQSSRDLLVGDILREHQGDILREHQDDVALALGRRGMFIN